MANIEIKQNENSLTEVWVDGHKMNRVKAYILEQSVDTVPTMLLHLSVLDKNINIQDARVDICVDYQTFQDALTLLKFELLKHSDIYDAFCASIFSVLKSKEQYATDSGVLIHAENGTCILAEEILKRIIGEE